MALHMLTINRSYIVDERSLYFAIVHPFPSFELVIDSGANVHRRFFIGADARKVKSQLTPRVLKDTASPSNQA